MIHILNASYLAAANWIVVQAGLKP
jgi:hypothetical protein